MASPLFSKQHDLGVSGAIDALARMPVVIVSEEHKALWDFVIEQIRAGKKPAWPKLPTAWRNKPPKEVWISYLPGRYEVDWVKALFTSLGAVVHEGTPSRFERADVV